MFVGDELLTSRWVERRRWRTLPTSRLVLAVARTPASTIRLLEALPIFYGSDVQVLFTVDPTSAYQDGVRDLLRGRAKFMPWSEIGSLGYDLALTASENVALEAITSPVVVLPHGIGFHKYVPDSRGAGVRISGVVPARYLRDDRVCMVVSHPEQEEQLRRSHPETRGHCVVAGDVVFDRLVASLPLRDHYRHALGVGPAQRLIVVTSTWGGDSLFGSRPELPQRLLGVLPADEYRVALILHPNVESWHGPQRLDQQLAFADLSGLLRIPPHEGWHAALIAADLVIGDNGSVTLYGAALDRPSLLGAVAKSIVPGTPPGEMARTVARISPDLPLREQVEQAIATHRAGRFDALRDRMFARRGEAAGTLRDLVFARLGLPVPPAPPPVTAVPAPRPRTREVCSFRVLSRMDEDGRVEIERFPIPAAAPREERGYVRHLCVREGEPIVSALENASVIVRDRIAEPGEATAWIERTLAAYGAYLAVAAVGDCCLAGTRDGMSLRCVGAVLDPSLVASAVYTLIRSGAVRDRTVTVVAGGAETRFALEVR